MVNRLFENDLEIDSKGFEYLADIITDDIYSEWFCSHIVNVLNKTHCGNGGTTGLIRYALSNYRGLLVLVPNVSITRSKEFEYRDNQNVCCVYGGSDNFNRNAMVVVATYDQFPRLMKELKNDTFAFDEFWNSHKWSGRLIVVDEYDKLVDECNFRDICFEVTNLVKSTSNGCLLMSATPHWGYVGLLRDCCEREIKTYTVKYDEEKKGIMFYNINKNMKDILKKTKEHNRHTVVFYNSVKSVKKLLSQIGDSECEVLCAKKNMLELGEYYSDSFSEDKKLHFMTSAYFTGCDINTYVDNCIIVGSQQFGYMCYSARMIKQMLGRFRKGVGGIHLFYKESPIDKGEYSKIKDKYDRFVKDYNVGVEDFGDLVNKSTTFIKLKQEMLNLKDILDNYAIWFEKDKLYKMLEENNYKVYKKDIGEFEKLKKRKNITFKEAKKRIVEGKKLSYSDCDEHAQLEAYYKEKGKEALLNVSKGMLNDWWKIRMQLNGERIDSIAPSDLFNALGLENFGRYKARYLKNIIEYIECEDCTYDDLTKKMYDLLDTYIILDKKDDRGHLPGDVYLIMKREEHPNTTKKGCEKHPFSIYRETTIFAPKKSVFRMFSRHIKYDTDGHCIGGTFSLEALEESLSSLSGISLYDYIQKDKPNRLPEIKKTSEWKNIKNYRQTKISELYKDTNYCYRHTISNMDKIDSLIIDIDNGLPFSTFRKIYEDYQWTAYPTISNLTEDWTKFRVIVPLAETLQLEGENNLRVLKLLRSWFCHWEDKEHQMASYINNEDWKNRYENKGEILHINQRIVDNLMISVKNSREFASGAFKKTKMGITPPTTFKSLTWAINYYTEHCPDGVDDVKHKTTYMIGKNLSNEDRKEFENWLVEYHPTVYKEHWKSHTF